MKPVLHLSSVKRNLSKSVDSHLSGSRVQELAHEIKNCMSMLLLTFAEFDGEREQEKISSRQRRLLEDIIFEMNQSIDELLHFTNDRGGPIQQKVHRHTQ